MNTETAAQVAAADDEITVEATKATRHWKRLGHYCDPMYVRNINGQRFVITDTRGYHDGQKDFWGWKLETLETWMDMWSVDAPESWRTLAEAKEAAEYLASERANAI